MADEAITVDRDATRQWVVPAWLQQMILLCADGRIALADGYKDSAQARSAVTNIRRNWGRYNGRVTLSIEQFLDIQKGDADYNAAESDMISTARDLIHEAARTGASDIHLRLFEERGYGDIRVRINGRLESKTSLTHGEMSGLLSVLGGVMPDVGNGHYNPAIPQAARIGQDTGHLPKNLQSLRIQSSPMLGGTYMVNRLLYQMQLPEGGLSERLRAFGYEPQQSQAIQQLTQCTDGIVIVSGPTGSGKSTSLAMIVRSILEAHEHLNFITVEDPPEFNIRDAEQLSVVTGDSAREREGAFASAIRAMLRLDPDRAMIGEMRDAESASLAIKASVTGHQVWTTLHANSAWKTLQRLSQLCERIKDTQVLVYDADITRGLIAQRLVTKLCQHCAKPLVGNEDKVPRATRDRLQKALRDFSGIKIRGEGCKHCSERGAQRGTNGRTMIAEVVLTSPEYLEMAKEHGVSHAQTQWRKDGGITMMGHGLMKIARGEIEPRALQDVLGEINPEESPVRAVDTRQQPMPQVAQAN